MLVLKYMLGYSWLYYWYPCGPCFLFTIGWI